MRRARLYRGENSRPGEDDYRELDNDKLKEISLRRLRMSPAERGVSTLWRGLICTKDCIVSVTFANKRNCQRNYRPSKVPRLRKNAADSDTCRRNKKFNRRANYGVEIDAFSKITPQRI